MAKLIVRLTKEDVSLSVYEQNYVIRTKDGIDVMFSVDAFEKMINEYNEFIKGEH